ncbi:hypothetical protein QFZ58_005022 [Streptomyces sp. B1I3]|nr:hypothetical protein [Streptomyces sp. B1I3]
MTIVLNEPGVDGLTRVVDALRVRQDDRTPLQLHPGDLGWAWALGAERLAAAVRTWSVDGRIIAVGYLDETDQLRLTTAPDLRQDGHLARRLLADLDDPERGVLPPGKVGSKSPTVPCSARSSWRRAGFWTSRGRRCATTSPSR